MTKTNLTLRLTLLLFVSLTFLISCSSDENEMMPTTGNNTNGNPTGGMVSGDDAPDFSLTSVNGPQVMLSDFEGKPLVIFFFGSTCPLCIASAPSVEADIHQAYTSDQLSIIGIDTWDGTRAAVNNFSSNTGTTYDLLLNGSGVQRSYGTTYDRLVVIDADGKIVHMGTTAASSDVNTVLGVIENLL